MSPHLWECGAGGMTQPLLQSAAGSLTRPDAGTLFPRDPRPRYGWPQKSRGH